MLSLLHISGTTVHYNAVQYCTALPWSYLFSRLLRQNWTHLYSLCTGFNAPFKFLCLHNFQNYYVFFLSFLHICCQRQQPNVPSTEAHVLDKKLFIHTKQQEKKPSPKNKNRNSIATTLCRGNYPPRESNNPAAIITSQERPWTPWQRTES